MLNIKRFLLLGFIFTLGSCASNPKHVRVDDMYQPHFDYLVTLFDENDIKINYRKIKYVRVLEMPGVHGKYNRKHKIIYIDKYFNRWDWLPIYTDVKTIVLAHELAHSQKIWHNNDTSSIMCSKVDLYITDIINKKGIDKPILDAFKNNY